MLQNTSKTLGFKEIMVYKTFPGVGEVNHIWLVAYKLFGLRVRFLAHKFIILEAFEENKIKTD